MVTVTKQGYIPIPVVPHYEIICKKCHAVFECDEPDLHRVVIGYGQFAKGIYCPCCHTEINDWYGAERWARTNG